MEMECLSTKLAEETDSRETEISSFPEESDQFAQPKTVSSSV